MMAALDIEKLNFSYGTTPILRSVTFTIESGEFIGIVGPNGSGKTTLLRCITGALKKDNGRITLGGREIEAYTSRELAQNIGVVPQGSTVDFGFSVGEIVMMGRHPHQPRFTFETNEDIGIVNNSLKLTGTLPFRDKLITHLSGGELQRVLIARALAQQPGLLLLDEPTAHLDISHQLEIMDLMASLNAEKNITIIGVFHDLNLAARYCKRLLIMHEGKIVDDGLLEEVLTPKNLSRVFHINAAVRRNPVTNNLFIDPIRTLAYSSGIDRQEKKDSRKGDTAKGELKRTGSPKKLLKIHIVCGAGTGTELIKSLSDEGYDISSGVLNVLDQDHQTIERLNLPVVSEAAFSPISKKSHKMNLQLISNSDFVILTNVPFGPANIRNMEALDYARKIGKIIIVFDPDKNQTIDNRDFTNGKVTDYFKRIIRNAKFAHSSSELKNLLDVGKFSGKKKF
jgi:iron complex transport system ATP-binding protein